MIRIQILVHLLHCCCKGLFTWPLRGVPPRRLAVESSRQWPSLKRKEPSVDNNTFVAFVRTEVAAGSEGALARSSRLKKLMRSEGNIEQVEVALVQGNDTAFVVHAGPFKLQCGDRASECVPALLWCFACLAAEDEEPEVTFDEAEAASDFLRRLLSRHRHQAIADTIAMIDIMVADAAKLSPEDENVLISPKEVLSSEECQLIIADAEAHASLNGGWESARHEAHATTDLAVDDVPALAAWLPQVIKDKLLTQFETAFALDAESLYIDDMFVAKYEAKIASRAGADWYNGSSTRDGVEMSLESQAQAGLGEHTDSSAWSFVLPLNPRHHFQGGGTKFVDIDREPTFSPPMGYATMFNGKNRHSGVPVSAGVRYILAGFLDIRQGENPLDKPISRTLLPAFDDIEAGDSNGLDKVRQEGDFERNESEPNMDGDRSRL
eukprot:gnl/MRDRNA2_/MRDRNA2_25847_c0_seq1.p1 gnl/MRDRNA2_/MRDRNA2_25847_c0~~gnl/MRDRNA2_/MRDRNA2_25847_c0_seq1.p1  ORF type:complete len:437 (-),score=85.25 gnl/MRDRNA2_/MRDRNA2_25847_c0_seq1:156-1466(-)